MKRLFTLLTLTMQVGACSSVTSGFNDMASNMRFTDRNDIARMRGTDIDEVKYTGYGITDNISDVGALSVNHFDDVTGKTDPTIINFKRSNGVFYAQTKLSDSDNQKKNFFNETDLNVGLDNKAQGINLGLSMKFQ